MIANQKLGKIFYSSIVILTLIFSSVTPVKVFAQTREDIVEQSNALGDGFNFSGPNDGSVTTLFGMNGDLATCPSAAPISVNGSNNLNVFQKDCKKIFRQPDFSQQTTMAGQVVLSSGGPDEFGYTFDDAIPFSWVDVPTGNGITAADDYALGPIDISGSFDFPFYGVNYSSLYISSNGLITFDGGYGSDYGGVNIPNSPAPNNFIAPFWEDLVIESGIGAAWYAAGGDAPNRYFAVEWRDVTTYAGSDPFSFQVLLYENGDILVQHQSLPASYNSTVGIENAAGDDGLEYQVGGSGLSAPKAIKFTYPTAATPRLQVTPLTSGKFASTGNNTYFPLTITNIGSAGSDVYDLTATSSWSTDFYEEGCSTPLSDTDADTVIDTGSIPQGTSMIICVGFTPPAGLAVGDENSASVQVTSSLDTAKTKNAEFRMVIPTSFAQVFEDYTSTDMAFRVVTPEGTLTNFISDNLYYVDEMGTIVLPDGRYFYAWSSPDRSNFNSLGNFSDIEFTFVDHNGSTNTTVSKLTSNSSAGPTYSFDLSPKVAVTPNGTVGILWYRWIYDSTTGLYNFNIYLALLASNGSIILSPANLTNNNLWDNYDDVNVPHYSSPAIAGTDDNRFILSWQDFRMGGGGPVSFSIWYATYGSTGTVVSSPVVFSNGDQNLGAVLNPLSGGKAIMTWNSYATGTPYFAVIGSNGSVLKTSTPIDLSLIENPAVDAVHLPNGKTAIALGTGTGAGLVILDANFNIAAGPVYSANPYANWNGNMSVTYDSSNRIVFTWTDSDTYPPQTLFYALAEDTGIFTNSPVPFRTSSSGLMTSYNQGNAPYLLPVVLSITRNDPSPTGAASVAFTVTFSEDVTGVDVGDLALTTTGVTGASIIGLSGSGHIYTVTVHTGSGNGTIRLDVNDNDSILDAAGDPLGGEGNDNGDYATGAVYTITEAPTPTLPPGVMNHARDFSTPFVPPSSSASGILPVLTKPAQQVQSSSVSTYMPVPEPVLLTSTPHLLSVEAISPTSTPEPVVVVSVADVTAPETTFLVTPGSTSRQRSAFFAYESTKAGTFICSLDGGAYFACDASIRFTGLSEGMHVFQVRAVDEVGNYDASPAIYTWMIERNLDIQRYKMMKK